MFSFVKKWKKDYPLKILGLHFDKEIQDIQVKTHLLGENIIEHRSLLDLLEDETAINLIHPKDLLQLKEIETLYSFESEIICVTKLFFIEDHVELFYPDSNHYEKISIPELLKNTKLVNKIKKEDLLRIVRRYTYFSSPKVQSAAHKNNLLKFTLVK